MRPANANRLHADYPATEFHPRRPWHPALRMPPDARGRSRAMTVARLDESGKQRVRLQRLRFELRMELHRHVPRMLGQLDDLDELSVVRPADDLEATLGERPFEQAVELVAMPVPLVDDRLAVKLAGERSRLQLARVRSEPHRAAEVVDAEQVAKLVDHVVAACPGRTRWSRRRRDRTRGGRIRPPPTGSRSRCRSRGCRRSRAISAARIMPRVPRSPKPPGTRMPCGAVEQLFAARLFQRFGFDPADVDAETVLESAVVERFVQALVRILVADVLADDVDGDLVGRILDAVDEVDPGVHLRFASGAG